MATQTQGAVDPTIQVDLESENLYRNGYVVYFPDQGEMALMRELYVWTPNPDDQYHTVMQGDTLDGIACTYYQNIVGSASSKYWWLIADANNIYNPLDWITPYLGQSLIIPDFKAALLSLTTGTP